MENETLCCICLEELCEFKTNCCRNEIHKGCLINWFLYTGSFTCPICRSETIRVNIEDILHYKSNSELQIDDNILIQNLNKLVNSYNLEYRITVELPNYTIYPYNSYALRYRCLYSSLNCCACFPSRVLKHLMYLFMIPVFYIILMILLNYVSLNKTAHMNAIINAD